MRGKLLSRWLTLISFVSGVPFASLAQAVPLPSGPDPSSDLIINFDFTSPPQIPAPPYAVVTVALDFSEVIETGESVAVDTFGDLDGAGPLESEVLMGPFVGFGYNATLLLPETADGIFSVGVRMIAGDGDLRSFTALASDTVGGDSVRISGVLRVPEPTTLALLGVALVGLGFSRRRKLH